MFKVEIGWFLGGVNMQFNVLWRHLCNVHIQPLLIVLMDNNQGCKRRLGIVRPEPTQREAERVENVERHHMWRAWGKVVKVSKNIMTFTL